MQQQQLQVHDYVIDIGKKVEGKRKTEKTLENMFKRLNTEVRKIYADLDRDMKRILCDAEPTRDDFIDGPRHDLAEMLSNILSPSFDGVRENNTLTMFGSVEQLRRMIDQL